MRDVLFLVADQWRGDALGHLGRSGTSGALTPNLDRLAAAGVSFVNHRCQGSPCGPSRRTLLTGTTTRTHGQWTNHEPAACDRPTLAGEAARAGVRPLLVGYTDTPSPRWDPGQGWQGRLDQVGTEEEWAADLCDPSFELVRPFFWQLGFPAYRRHLQSLGLGPPGDDMMGIYPPAGPPGADGLAASRIPAEHSDTAWLTDGALGLLDGRGPGEGRMLLHVNWLRPHPPLVPPAPWHRAVHPDEVELPARSRSLDGTVADHPFFAAAAGGRSMTEYVQQRCRVESITEAHDRRLRAAYLGLCAEVDHHVGRLLDRLQATGRWDDTLIVFLSDHGDALGDRWLYGRRGPFDGHSRVPCIVRDPRPSADANRGAHIDRFTGNADVMPTVLDALGLASPAGLEGRSLLPLVRGEATPGWPEHARFEMDWSDHGPAGARFVTVRTDRHRYVHFADHSGGHPGLPPMLFDVIEDPLEEHDRADEPALSGLRADLHALAVASG